MKKFRVTVLVELEDDATYTLDEEGHATGEPTGIVQPAEVCNHVADAVYSWGGQYAPGDPLFPSNIKRVRAHHSSGITVESKRD